MVTRFRVETNSPTQRLTLHVSLVSPLPKSYRDAFNDPNWQNAMCDEYNALIKNKTWTLVPRPTDTNIVRCMWLFLHRYLADGTLSRYKARLVANGSTLLAASRHWLIHQLDVKNAFLHGDLSDTVYMHQTPGFRDSMHPDYRMDTAYLLLYVDDIVLTASFETLLQWIIASLHQEFSIMDLGSLNYFLGISVTWDSSGMFLSQRKYVVEILDKAHMVNCNPNQTPIDTESKLGDDGDPVSNLTLYQSLVDVGWAGCPTTRRSTSGYYVSLGNNLLSWSSKRQSTLSHSSTEAEYRGVANVVVETCWLRNLLRELHTPLSSATLVYYDNVNLVADGQDNDVAWWVDSGGLSMYLRFSSGKIVSLFNVLLVHTIMKNLVSSNVLNNRGYKQVIESDKFVLSKHGMFISFGYLCNHMLKRNTVNDIGNSAFMSTSKLNDYALLHTRLGHIHFKRMQDMSNDELIPVFDMDTKKCKTCMLAKITKKLFQNVKREIELLELIHSDICDLHATPSLENKKYFVTFIDDVSRFYYVYLLHTKYEALDKFKVFKTEVELQQRALIKRFSTDKRGEYMDTLYF
ncbi:ribonuclease H-like domain-containing protein [Tanacetum coccineum]